MSRIPIARTLYVFLTVVLLLGGVSGCFKGAVQVPNKVNVNVTAGLGLDAPTRQVLEDGYAEIGRQPEKWQATMESIIEKLGQVGTDSAKQVLDKVHSVYSDALGNTGGEVSCRSDFYADRVKERLQEILHEFLPVAYAAPVIVPVVCHTEPNVIDQSTRVVKYFGYDFLKFKENGDFAIQLQYANGEIVRPNIGFVSVPHNYELQVDIQGVRMDDLQLDRTRGPRLVVIWGSDRVQQSEITVLLPEPLPPTATPITITAFYKLGIEGTFMYENNENVKQAILSLVSWRDVANKMGLDPHMGILVYWPVNTGEPINAFEHPFAPESVSPALESAGISGVQIFYDKNDAKMKIIAEELGKALDAIGHRPYIQPQSDLGTAQNYLRTNDLPGMLLEQRTW